MKKFSINIGFLALLLMTAPVYAQTADEPAEAPAAVEEPAPVVAAPSAPATPPVIAAPSVPSVSNEPILTKALREGIPLRVRQEQPFDTNANNRLEPDEIRAFLRSVSQESSRGTVKNTSDLLYQFDRNKDGYIDRSESSGFPL